MATVNITLLPLYSNHYMYKIYKEPVIKLNNFMRLRKKHTLIMQYTRYTEQYKQVSRARLSKQRLNLTFLSWYIVHLCYTQAI